MSSEQAKPWAARGGRVAWRIFLLFLGRFSKRTLLTKSVVWKAAQQTLSIPPAAAQGLQCISTWEPRPYPEGSQRVSQNPCSEDASKSNPSQWQKTRHALGGLTGGFVGRFCGGFLGLAGGFRGGRAPADFLFSAGGFSGGFFRRIFLLYFATKKIHRKIHHFHGSLLADFPP